MILDIGNSYHSRDDLHKLLTNHLRNEGPIKTIFHLL